MPVEDWIEKWTDMQTKEMGRIERQHGERMDKIEKSVDSLNDKMDALSAKMDTKMDDLARSIQDRNERHAIDLAVIKTKIAIYAATAAALAAGVIAWTVNFFSK